MRITALAGGVGGARFLRGLSHHLDRSGAAKDATVTVVGNTGDDITLFGLRVCPDLDTILYTLGGGVEPGQGWGRAGDTHHAQAELAALDVRPQWFALGDKDVGTHLARSLWLGQGYTLSEVTARLAERWGLPGRGVRLLPMTDTPVETHVVVADDQGERAIHFQEWWVRLHAAVTARRFLVVGIDQASPAPGVLDAIADADVVLLPPSNPVVSIGVILGVPGLRQALIDTRAPVVGVSPLVSGRPVRGYADACLAAIGVDTTAAAVAELYRDLLDGWLVDIADAGMPYPQGLVVRPRPLLMSDVEAAADIAAEALQLADALGAMGR